METRYYALKLSIIKHLFVSVNYKIKSHQNNPFMVEEISIVKRDDIEIRLDIQRMK